jgi:hypothetical protein
MGASSLRDVQMEWVAEGRPPTFKPNKVLEGSCSDVFFFTNSFQIQERTYQCRFGLRYSYPSIGLVGILARTDEGTLLWISAKDNKATVDPLKNPIEL